MEAVSRTPATLDQVARAAGVSGKTASRVFVGGAQVSDETRRAVERAAAELVELHAVQESDSLHARLQAHGIPAVRGGRASRLHEVSYVALDNHADGRAATEHLIEMGRKRIGHIADPRELSVAGERFQGF